MVVGLGIQWGGQTSSEVHQAISAADEVLFAVSDPFAARFVRSLHPAAQPLPYAAPGEPRPVAYQAIVDCILAALRRGGRVCAVFYGDPSFLTAPAHQAVHQARVAGYRAQMLPGVSALSCLCADLGVDPGAHGLQLYEATDFLRRRPRFELRSALVLCQIGWIGQRVGFDERQQSVIQAGLQRLGDALLAHYPPAHPLVVYEAASHPLVAPRSNTVALSVLAQAAVSDCATLYVPPLAESHDPASDLEDPHPSKEDLA